MKIAENMNLTNGVIGGLIIGVSSSYALMQHHKITGISGIVETALNPTKQDKKGLNVHGFWTWSYIAGLLTSGYSLVLLQPESFGSTDSPAAVLSPLGVALAGVLTGFGTRLGSGCTSGHGICGLPRRSLRSLTAVCSFMATGAMTAYITRVYRGSLSALFSAEGVSELVPGFANAADLSAAIRPVLYILGGAFVAFKMIATKNSLAVIKSAELRSAPKEAYNEPTISSHVGHFGAGALFGVGLGVSGMTDPSRVQGFLDFTSPTGWDPTLAGVMGGGVLLNLLTFEYMRRNDHASSCPGFVFDKHEKNTKIDTKLLVGSGIFGVAWGLGGMCPGPALVSSVGAISQGVGNGAAAIFMPFMFLGMAMLPYVVG